MRKISEKENFFRRDFFPEKILFSKRKFSFHIFLSEYLWRRVIKHENGSIGCVRTTGCPNTDPAKVELFFSMFQLKFSNFFAVALIIRLVHLLYNHWNGAKEQKRYYFSGYTFEEVILKQIPKIWKINFF